MLEIKQLTKTYGKVKAVSTIAFSLPPGTLAGFLGPNGAGKTTTINMITGLINPTEGNIFYKKENILKNLKDWKMKFGAVFEDPLLFHKLTLFEHILLAGQLYNLTKKETIYRGEGLFDYLNLLEYKDVLADEASTGMKKKCALSLALFHKPEVLICDEVFNGIDPVSSKRIQSLFHELLKKGTIILFSSHTLPIVEKLAQKIIIIIKGKISLDFSVSDICNQNTDKQNSLEEIFFKALGNPAFDMSRVSWLK